MPFAFLQDVAGPLIIMFFLIFFLLNIILPVVAIIDVVKSEFPNPNDKIMWVLIIIFLGCIGVFIYFLVNKGKGTPSDISYLELEINLFSYASPNRNRTSFTSDV